MHNRLLLSTHTRFFIFTTVFLLSFSLRIFQIPPHGGDSISNSIRINSIIDNGYIGWFLSILSLFGWYPFSYPTGVHSLLSSFALVIGLDTLQAIFIFSLFQLIL